MSEQAMERFTEPVCTFTRRGVVCGMPTRLVHAGPLYRHLADADGKVPCHAGPQDAKFKAWIASGLPDHDAVTR